MVSSKASARAELDADEAINRVLEVEQDALATIRAAEAAAAERVSGARADARRIAERAAARSRALEARCQDAVAARVEQLEREAAVLSEDAQPADPRRDRLDAAIASYGDRLIEGGR